MAEKSPQRDRERNELMPFADISFLWFIGAVRDGFGITKTASSRLSSWAAVCCFWR